VTRGTGKSLLVNICCIVATGSPANVRGFEASDEEMRKAITSILKANPGAIIAFDNVRGAMKSSPLAGCGKMRVDERNVLSGWPVQGCLG
jgi:hypothetical protein